MTESKISSIGRVASLFLLIGTSFWFYSSAWRLPVGDISFSSIAALGANPSLMPFSKSELVMIALSSLLVAYLCVILARSWTVFGTVTALALLLSALALGHRYPLTIFGVGSDLVSTILGPTVGINTERDLKVLAAPNSTSQAIEIVPIHAALILKGREGSWYQATVSGGRTGWVPSEKIIIP